MKINGKKSIWEIITAGVLGVLFVFVLTACFMRVPASAKISVDESVLYLIEGQAKDENGAEASCVQAAESSRQKRIQDSIDYSIYIEESIAASVAESASIEESIKESVEESLWQEKKSSIAASLLELAEKYQSEEDASREEEEYLEWLMASIEASREAVRESSREQASREQASREEESRKAAAATRNTIVTPWNGENVVFFGDSRTSGFYPSIYNCWPGHLIGHTVSRSWGETARQELQALIAQNPVKAVFMNAGDDVSAGLDVAITNYEAVIRNFSAQVPNCKIYVVYAIPATDAAVAARPFLGLLPEYNVLLKDMCERNGWTFVYGNQGFSPEWCYASDGVHFTPSWTRQWFNNIRAEVGF